MAQILPAHHRLQILAVSTLPPQSTSQTLHIADSAMRNTILLITLLLVFLTGCSQAAPEPPPPAAPIDQAPPALAPTQTITASRTPRPTITIEPSATNIAPIELPHYASRSPVDINIQTHDGITLRGYFYPAAQKGAPVVVMMHQFRGNQTLWHIENPGFIAWLQNFPTVDGSIPTPSADGQLAAINPALTFNVLTFDFRGHGESGGILSEDFSIYLVDARAAYETARTLPNVDPDRIVGIGTSIGADAVVNACDQDYCRGAFAISPGSWLGVNFAESVSVLLGERKPVRCMYADNDTPSPETCWSVAPNEKYKIFGYPGSKHGMTFFTPRKMEENFGKNIIEFLFEATQ
jgi:dienelactone hydrolase